MRTVRTTFRPDQTIEVDEATYLDFQRQGLLLDEPAPSAPTAPAAPATPKKTAGAAGSKES